MGQQYDSPYSPYPIKKNRVALSLPRVELCGHACCLGGAACVRCFVSWGSPDGEPQMNFPHSALLCCYIYVIVLRGFLLLCAPMRVFLCS